MNKITAFFAALALAAAALATQSAAAYGAYSMGTQSSGGTHRLIVDWVVNSTDSDTDATDGHLFDVHSACDNDGGALKPGAGFGNSFAFCDGAAVVSHPNSNTLERQCFAVRAANYNSNNQTFTLGGGFNHQVRRFNIVFNPNDPNLDTDAKAIAAAQAAATASISGFPGGSAGNLVDLSDFDSTLADNTFVLCDTTPLTTCHAGSGVGVNMAGDACEVQFDPSTACTGNQAESVGGGSCEECGDGTRPILPSRTACEFDPDSCELDQFAEFGDCVSCSQVSRVAGTDGANCGACIPNFIPNEASAGGVNKPCMLDPTSCGENQYGVIGGNSCESCSDLNREGGVAGANCGACQEFHSTNSATLGGEADDAAGNHTQCNFAQGLCTGNNRVEGTTCVACPANHAQDGNDNTVCVFDPGSCTAMQYADSDSCESCNDLNRQAGAAGEFCGACVANHTHADAIGGDGDACTFDPTSCTDMAQFSPGNTATACGTCATLNREGADGTSCGTCLTNFEHETENDGGITECTAIDFDPTSCTGMAQFSPGNTATACGTCATLNREGADGISCGACLTDFEHATENDGGITECTAIDGGGDGDFGVVLPTLDSENISGQGTTEIPYTVPSDSLTAFMFPVSMAIVNGSGNYSYSVDSSSEFLQIDEDGVVSFTAENVGNDTYSIIIEITDIATSETTTVTIVVAVADAIACNGGTVTGGVCECPNNQVESEGVCGCPSGTTENQAGVCETNETIACEGGTVTNGECVCPTNTRLNNGRCRTITGNGSTFPVVIPPVDNGKNRDIVALAHGALGVVVISYLFYSNILLDLTWSPAYSFSNNNGNTFYSVGSRWQATSDNWGFYWQTTGDNNQDFVYSSGVRYNNGIFAAAYDGKTDQTETDMQANVSAYKNVGDYDFAAAYYLDAVVDKKKSEIDNRFDLSAAINWQPWRLSAAMSTDGKERQRLNLIANYTIEKWILSATANTNGKSTTTKINYSYRF